MEFEDYLEPEIAVTAVVAAAIFSPQGRKLIRSGAVYGLAGLLTARDAIGSFTRSIGRGFQEAGSGNGTRQGGDQSRQGAQEHHLEGVGG